jgi:L-sorbose 1-phosphate reductase
MTDRLDEFRRGKAPAERTNRLWPLFAAGLENLGVEDKPISEPLPPLGPDQLLIRHDACGLCFSDIKVIRLGQDHPRVTKDMKVDPVVWGHEVAITVVEVGSGLAGEYQPGDRYIVQAEIYKNGINQAYGYNLRGGLEEYGIVDDTILNGDDGNYLLPVQPETGYAESALTEPWACVTAAYELTYRTQLKKGGVTWIVGGPDVGDRDYTIGAGFDESGHPDRLLLTGVPASFATWLRERAAVLGVPVEDVPLTGPDDESVDDLVILEPTPELIEAVSPKLAGFAVCALVGTRPLERKVQTDIGRIHYNRWVYVGGAAADVARAYSDVPVRACLKEGGAAWFVGAGGPMGRMHVQRAIQAPGAPGIIVCTDVSDMRLQDLMDTYADEALAKGIEFVCLNPTRKEAYDQGMARFRNGFDDIIVLAPVAPLIADAANWLADGGVMNVFAGVARGTVAALELSDAYLSGKRIIGHSASSIDDLKFMLHQAETGTLSPNRSVAAIGSLEAVKDGLRSVMETVYPGKVVIYPHIKPLPLTAITDLKDVLPTVYAQMKNGREWTNKAEEELLRVMLKD